jgi:L-threonylcarbamoyladenylate synthase
LNANLRISSPIDIPAETVYGLGANALDESAVKRIFEFKGRPLTSPLIVHLSTPEKCKAVLQLSTETERAFDALAAAFWPGPLTIVARAAACIPLLVTAGTGFVGVRIPSHPLALALLAATGLPIAAPSANRFGHVSPTKAVHVKNDLGTLRLQIESVFFPVCAQFLLVVSLCRQPPHWHSDWRADWI